MSTKGLHYSVLLWPLPCGHLTYVRLLPTELGSLSGPHYSLFISVHTQVYGFKLNLVLQMPLALWFASSEVALKCQCNSESSGLGIKQIL